MRKGERPTRGMRLLRIQPGDENEVLSRLESAAKEPSVSRRKHRRYRYQLPTLEVNIRQPGDATGRWFEVTPRNLGARGIGLLHGSFVHAGSSILVQLRTLHGSVVNVAGVVCTCRYIRVGIYELGVRFAAEISPADFCTDARSVSVAVLEADEMIGGLIARHLEAVNARVHRVRTGQALITDAIERRFDLLLVDLDSTVIGGGEAVRQLRARGYLGRIVGMTAFEDAAEQEAQIDLTIPRPASREEFVSLVQDELPAAITSAYQDDPQLRDLIQAFVAGLPGRVRDLEGLLVAGDLRGLARAARALGVSAMGFGFPPVTAAAVALESACADPGSIVDVARRLRALSRLVQQARPPASTAAA